MLENKPYDPSGVQISLKTVFWLIVWLFIAFVSFILLIWTGSIIEEALKNQWVQSYSANPLIWLLFLAVAFVATVIGNGVLSGIYNIIRPEKYYDFKKTTTLLIIFNVILFIIFFILYFLVGQIWWDIEFLYRLFAFHILFSIFMSLVFIEIVSNPSYAWVYLLGSATGFVIALALFFMLDNSFSTWGDQAYIMLFPSVIWFSIISLFSGIFEKIYYKFYEMGNNFLFIPSIEDVLVDEEDDDEINIDM